MLLYVSIFSAVLGMFQFGFNTGAINTPQKFIEAFINASHVERTGDGRYSEAEVGSLFSAAVAAWLVGGMISALTAGLAADKLGRRRGLLYAQALSVIGAALMAASKVRIASQIEGHLVPGTGVYTCVR